MAMNSAQVYDAYVDRSWRFLVELQHASGMDFVVGKREGNYLWNLENSRRVLDCGNSGGVYSFGHRNPEILATLLDALGRFDAGIWTMPTPEALEFQDTVAASAPHPAICRTVLGLSASDSIDLAIMFAFRVTGRRKVLAFSHGYHGHSGFAALATGSPTEGLFEHYSLPTDHSVFFPQYGSLADIERHMGPECAAVILEPMNFETFQPAPAGYLEGVAALCRRHGALLILDETRTALGRSGRLWMTAHYSAEPDMLIMGKGLGAGLYPVSALATTRAVYDECMNSTRWGFMSSMAGSPVAALVARKTLDMAQRPALVENVTRLERALAGRFSDLCERYPDVFVPAWIKGGIAALGLRQPSAARIVRGELFRRNLLCHSVSEIEPAVIKFLPCLTAGADVVDEMATALADFAVHQRRGVAVDV
jgi:acetylornithine aminotransferase